MIMEQRVALKFSGPLSLSIYGRKVVARSMCEKGKSFLQAAVLLEQQGGNKSVVLYLVCQGIEIMLKGLLLFKDFEKYSVQNKCIGHDLIRLKNEILSEYKVKPLPERNAKEIANLNSLYSKHLLRYGTGYDFFWLCSL